MNIAQKKKTMNEINHMLNTKGFLWIQKLKTH